MLSELYFKRIPLTTVKSKAEGREPGKKNYDSREACSRAGSRNNNSGCVMEMEHIGIDQLDVEIENKRGLKNDFKYFGLSGKKESLQP